MNARHEMDAAIRASRASARISEDLLGRLGLSPRQVLVTPPLPKAENDRPEPEEQDDDTDAQQELDDHSAEWDAIERENRIRDARNAARNDEVEP